MGQPSTAEIAVQIDRLVIGVHRTMFGEHRSTLEPMVAEAELSAPGLLFDVAEFVLDRSLSAEVVLLRFRYLDHDEVMKLVDDLQGRDGDGQAAVDRLLHELLRLRSEVAQTLWPDDLSPAIAGCLQATELGHGPLTEPYRRLPEPSVAAHQLHHLLTGLRYARTDAHQAAWSAAGLEVSEIIALDAAIAGESDSVPPGLIERGWLTPAGTATTAGRAARMAIEAGTNQRCEPMFGAVTDLLGWYQALVDLSSAGESA